MIKHTIKKVSYDEVIEEEIFSKSEPVIIKGILDKWNAVKSWNISYFESKVGHKMVPVEIYPKGDYYSAWISLELQFQHYLKLLKENHPEKYYLADLRISDYLPELLSDIKTPDFISRHPSNYVALFAGTDSVSAVHYHAQGDALLCQVFGKKKLTLFSPDDFSNLYFEPWYSSRFNFSRINFSSVDMEKFPNFTKAKPYECLLESGEALFIPIHWGHLSEGIDVSISATFFWDVSLFKWKLSKQSLYAKLGTSFRKYISKPIAKLLSELFRYKLA